MKRVLALTLVPALAVTLAACGGDDGGSGGSMSGHSMSSTASPTGQAQAGQHNDQDVTFAQMMIPHHQQAIEMAKLAPSRASSAEVKKLAADIEKAQDPEIKQMSGWLSSWGASQPSPGMSGMDMPGMDHGGMQGQMTEQEMKQLENAKGAAFDKAFLEMMIKHHQGAVDMAKTEQTKGQFPEAKTMAGNIITSQTAEITKMRALLKNM
jgi:uncharacterized protein (DUF305 family)